MLIDRAEGTDQQIPRIVCINDGNIPDRTAFLTGGGEDPVPLLRRNAQLLLDAGANVIAIPCNTSHSARILDRLIDGLVLNIIHMPRVTVAAAKAANRHKLLILATVGTVQSGVYSEVDPLITCIYPNEADQQIVSDIIAKVKTGTKPAELSTTLAKVIGNYEADAAILACTELSMVPIETHAPMKTIDALATLADQCMLASNQASGGNGE
jgi:aspartate racemase